MEYCADGRSRFPGKSLFIVAAISFFATVSGCGPALPQVVPVVGTATLDGKPLENATLEFVPTNPELKINGKNGVATTDQAGKFEVITYFDPTHILRGLRAGEYKVAVTKSLASANAAGDGSTLVKPNDTSPEAQQKMQERTLKMMNDSANNRLDKGVPSKYGSPTSSDLKVIATAGMEPVKLELKN